MSSTIISTVSLSVVSLIAMVPDSECSTPILMVSCACAGASAADAAKVPATASALTMFRDVIRPSPSRDRHDNGHAPLKTGGKNRATTKPA